MSQQSPHRSVPGVDPSVAETLVDTLQARLVSLLDLQLALKHIHWNVVGPNFSSVHEMLDEQVVPVRDMSDVLAERIATLGGSPNGNPGAIVAQRSWDDYPHGRDSSMTHLAQLDTVYTGIITDHRAAVDEVSELDPVTEDILIGQTGQLEMFQWFVRSFIERTASDGEAPAPIAGFADRPPTKAEADLADEAAADVDLDSVGEHYQEMAEVGADVKGEGQIG